MTDNRSPGTTTTTTTKNSHQGRGSGGEGIHLIYQYFQVKARPKQGFNDWLANHRQTEYDECLERNLRHPRVERIHILLENTDDEKHLQRAISSFRETTKSTLHKKITIHHLGRRMLYSDAFEYANKNLDGCICVILNADIFLGDINNDKDDDNCKPGEIERTKTQSSIYQSLARQLQEGNKTVWSLTRHEKSQCLYWKNNRSNEATKTTISTQKAEEKAECGCPFIQPGNQYFGSHDSFWFVAPISTGVIENCQHVQNRWGAEHKVINELLRDGYRVLNPSKSIRTYHNHDSDVHPWRLEPGGQSILADPRDHPPIPPTFLL